MARLIYRRKTKNAYLVYLFLANKNNAPWQISRDYLTIVCYGKISNTNCFHCQVGCISNRAYLISVFGHDFGSYT